MDCDPRGQDGGCWPCTMAERRGEGGRGERGREDPHHAANLARRQAMDVIVNGRFINVFVGPEIVEDEAPSALLGVRRLGLVVVQRLLSIPGTDKNPARFQREMGHVWRGSNFGASGQIHVAAGTCVCL